MEATILVADMLVAIPAIGMSAAWLSRLHISIFVFLFIKIIIQGQICQVQVCQ